jgi:hypothetical protein
MLASVSDTLHVSATEELFSFSRNYLMVLDAKLGMQQWAPTDFLIQKCMPARAGCGSCCQALHWLNSSYRTARWRPPDATAAVGRCHLHTD